MTVEHKLDCAGGTHGSGQRISETDEYKRSHLIGVIERSVERMTLKELEALSYDMFTKGYIEAADL